MFPDLNLSAHASVMQETLSELALSGLQGALEPRETQDQSLRSVYLQSAGKTRRGVWGTGSSPLQYKSSKAL